MKRIFITRSNRGPGFVRTRPVQAHAPLSPQESAQGMLQVIDALTLDKTGSFLNMDGTEVP